MKIEDRADDWLRNLSVIIGSLNIHKYHISEWIHKVVNPIHRWFIFVGQPSTSTLDKVSILRFFLITKQDKSTQQRDNVPEEYIPVPKSPTRDDDQRQSSSYEQRGYRNIIHWIFIFCRRDWESTTRRKVSFIVDFVLISKRQYGMSQRSYRKGMNCIWICTY